MEGKLLSPLLIVLCEPSVAFGPIVQQKQIRSPNVYVTCSKSGKMNKNILEPFRNNSLSSNVETKCCLVQ